MAFIQGNTGNAAPSCAIQFTTQNVTPGSILVAIARVVVAGGTATLSDSDVTNVWIKAYEGLTAPSNNYVVWYCLNATGGAKNTLTIASTSSLYIRAAIGEWGGSGADNFAYTLGTVATGGSSNPATANAIKAYGSELILAFAFQTAISSATATAGGGFTTRVSNPAIANDVAIADVSATAGSYTPTVTYDSNTLWTIVPIAFNVSSYAVTSFNDVWTPKGTVIANSGGSQNGQPTVLHEGGSQCGLGAGNVFKMYYSNSGTTPGVYYAESLDGETGWTSSGVSNPIIAGQGFQRVYKSGTTYYCYSSSATSPGPAINVYTCTDGTGVNFSLAKANAIVVGSEGE